MNEVIKQRFKRYAAKTLEHEKDALREIIQEIALLGLWRAKFFEHAAFYGGTSLRILYGLDRFSEDLDFTLLAPDVTFKLTPYLRAVRDELTALGFEVAVESKEKKTVTPVESAFIKADTAVHLIKVGSKSRSTKGELLKVKFEADVNPAMGFETEAKQFFWPQPFSVTTCDLPSLLAGKLHAAFCRDRVRNVKGRDFYDLLWYVARNVKPNYTYLELKLKQSGHWPDDAPFDASVFKTWARTRLETLDVEAAKKDVERFIANPNVLSGWSKAAFLAAVDRL